MKYKWVETATLNFNFPQKVKNVEDLKIRKLLNKNGG